MEKHKGRVARLALWLIIVGAICGAFGMVLVAIFHPPTWVLMASGFLLGFVIPTPKWALRDWVSGGAP
jgi:hypothetical protein